MLIDDNDADRSILRRSLDASHSIEVVREASGGLTGIEVVKKQRPDIVYLISIRDLESVVEA